MSRSLANSVNVLKPLDKSHSSSDSHLRLIVQNIYTKVQVRMIILSLLIAHFVRDLYVTL